MLGDTSTIRARLEALLEVVLKNSTINKAFIPTIKRLATSFLGTTSEEQLRTGIIELRDKYIPWLLNGEVRNEDTPKK